MSIIYQLERLTKFLAGFARYFILFPILFCWLTCLTAQPLSAYQNGRIFPFSHENKYTLTMQDDQGFLWGYNRFNEVVRFDGTEYHTFTPDPDDSTGIQYRSRMPASFMKDTEGNIWITFFEGLDRYDPLTGHVEHFHEKVFAVDSIGPKGYYGVTEDGRGNFFIAGQNNCYLISKASGKIQKLLMSHVRLSFKDRQGHVWAWEALPDSRLVKLNPETWEGEIQVGVPAVELNNIPYEVDFEFDGKVFQIDSAGDDFFLVLGGNLFAFNTVSHQYRLQNSGLEPGELIYTAWCEGSTIIAGTSQNRVMRFDAGTGNFSTFLTIGGEHDNDDYIRKIFRSKDGILWIVTKSHIFQVLPASDLVLKRSFPENSWKTNYPSLNQFLLVFNGVVYFNTTQGLQPVLENDGHGPLKLEFSKSDFAIPQARFKFPVPENPETMSGFQFVENPSNKTLWMSLSQYPYGTKMFNFDTTGRLLFRHECWGGQHLLHRSYPWHRHRQAR